MDKLIYTAFNTVNNIYDNRAGYGPVRGRITSGC